MKCAICPACGVRLRGVVPSLSQDVTGCDGCGVRLRWPWWGDVVLTLSGIASPVVWIASFLLGVDFGLGFVLAVAVVLLAIVIVAVFGYPRVDP